MNRAWSLAGFALLALMAGCKRAPDPRQVVVYTSVDQPFAEPIFRDYEKRTGIKVLAVFDTEETKSTGVLNRLIAEAQHPHADVFWSGDPVRPFSLVKRDLVQPYASPAAKEIPDAFKDPAGMWTGSAARAKILLVNKDKAPAGERPRSIKDLADPRWKGRAAMANPLYGTTTMYVGALFTAWGDERAKAFLDQVKANGTRIASSNGEVKRLVASGEVAFGLTDTDDAHEALQDKAPVEVVYPDQDDLGTLVMPTTVVLMKGAPHPEEGRRLVDDLVSAEVERRMASAAAHMPLRSQLDPPAGVRLLSSLRPMRVDYAKVAEAIERMQPWLRTWVGF
jgi:iron(III) transport system substrate-binding protein